MLSGSKSTGGTVTPVPETMMPATAPSTMGLRSTGKIGDHQWSTFPIRTVSSTAMPMGASSSSWNRRTGAT